MGNQITTDKQNGEVINNILNKLTNEPMPQNANLFHPPNEDIQQSQTKTFSKLKNTRFSRADESNAVIRSTSKPQQQNNGERNMSPIHGFYEPPGSGSRALIRPNPNLTLNMNDISNSATFNPINLPRTPSVQNYTPNNRKTANKEGSKPSINLFQQFFGRDDSESQRSQKKMRSSSASHTSYAGQQQKINLLQSNAQIMQKRIQSLSKTLQQSQKSSQVMRFNLRNAEERIKYLQNQLNFKVQDVNRLNNILRQKDKQIFDGMSQIKTVKYSVQILEGRLKQSSLRQQWKDKEINTLNSTKSDLNNQKLRLQNLIKMAQQQLKERNVKISEMDNIIINKNIDIQKLKQQKTSLDQQIFRLTSEMELNSHKYEQESSRLNIKILDQVRAIDEYEEQTEQLNNKVQKLHLQELQLNATIGILEADVAMNKDTILKLNEEIKHFSNEILIKNEQIEKLHTVFDQQRSQFAKAKDMLEVTTNNFNNAKKIGQKQVQFLQNKLEEVMREKEKLAQEVQITKTVVLQRNKLFQRKVIYDLKQENNKLWAKLIQNSQQTAQNLSKDEEFWKNKMLQHKKESKKQENGKDELQMRYDNFIRKLQQNSLSHSSLSKQNSNVVLNIQSVSGSASLHKLQQNADFYKQKCRQLQAMVTSHIEINKSLKQQIQKTSQNQVYFNSAYTQLQQLRNFKKQLTQQNKRLKQSLDKLKPQFEQKQKSSQTKLKQLENKNIIYYQNEQKNKNELEQVRNENRRFADEIARLNNQIKAVRKWQQLYNDLKRKYDELLINSKQDYKGMYEELQKELQRLRGLYQLKQTDLDKLKRVNAQNTQSLQKQLAAKTVQLGSLNKNYQDLQKQFDFNRKVHEQLLTDHSNMENQLNSYRFKKDKTHINKDKMQQAVETFKAKLVQIQSNISKIKQIILKNDNKNQLQGLLNDSNKILLECQNYCGMLLQIN